MVNELPFGTFQSGKRDYLFRISLCVCPGNFPVGQTTITFTIPNRNFREFVVNGKQPLVCDIRGIATGQPVCMACIKVVETSTTCGKNFSRWIREIWHPGLWNSDNTTKNPKSNQRLESRIPYPSSNGIESQIHARRGIQNYLGFPYIWMWRLYLSLNSTKSFSHHVGGIWKSVFLSEI